jgi:hypothetical protein
VSNFLRAWFQLIPEPRLVRLGYFLLYLLLAFGGVDTFIHPVAKFTDVLGPWMAVLGFVLIIGGAISAVAVFPGIWWLERAGLIALGTGFFLRALLVLNLGSSTTGFIILLGLSLSLIIRFLLIASAPLSPKVR